MNYFIDERIPEEGRYNAISKARRDVYDILEARGFERIAVPTREYDIYEDGMSNLSVKLRQGLFIGKNLVAGYKSLNRIKAGDTVLVQYPPLNWTSLNLIIKKLKFVGAHIIAVVHDLDSIRHPSGGKIVKKWSYYEDVIALKKFDRIIVHNSAMKLKMQKLGYKVSKMITLKMFDYLMDTDMDDTSDRYALNKPLIVAGNLNFDKGAKSLFLYSDEEDIGVSFNLYGSGFEPEKADFLTYDYKGAVPPDEVCEKIEGSFGLVWDGDSRYSCRGEWGDYLKISNPHKFSMYVAAGIPVIVWKKAAIASLVDKYQLGLAVDDLYEIRERMDKLSEDDYRKMLENTKVFSRALRKGRFFGKALDKALLEVMN
ncbi:MAG: hypothetical protein KHZ87_02685 [Clostridiales bacterium]|nr:hypothetical protein [Clostridiales bacterium]MBS5877487.1 hypothetical protein [Clostridiales bacterium]MDU0938874.1 hypothetical protein [Clostridiales bacterium]MDU1041486.1 hypothetical protein [Clostridiales bacterium]